MMYEVREKWSIGNHLIFHEENPYFFSENCADQLGKITDEREITLIEAGKCIG
jgi:hypothetical protein